MKRGISDGAVVVAGRFRQAEARGGEKVRRSSERSFSIFRSVKRGWRSPRSKAPVELPRGSFIDPAERNTEVYESFSGNNIFRPVVSGSWRYHFPYTSSVYGTRNVARLGRAALLPLDYKRESSRKEIHRARCCRRTEQEAAVVLAELKR